MAAAAEMEKAVVVRAVAMVAANKGAEVAAAEGATAAVAMAEEMVVGAMAGAMEAAEMAVVEWERPHSEPGSLLPRSPQ